MKFYQQETPGKKAIRNLREAWKFLQSTRKAPNTAGTGAKADAKEWLEEAVQEVLRVYK